MTHIANDDARVKSISQKDYEILIAAVRDFHWMARRYADGRSSYAPGCLNEHVRKLLSMDSEFHPSAPFFARDGMGRGFDKLTDTEVAAAKRDMPRGHATPLAEYEGRPEDFANLAKATQEFLRLSQDGTWDTPAYSQAKSALQTILSRIQGGGNG